EQAIVDVLEHVVGRPVHDGDRQHRAGLGPEADHDLLAANAVLPGGRRYSAEDDAEREGQQGTEGAHGGLLQERSLGWGVSRSQAPTRFTPRAVSARAAPGNAASHQAT